MKNQFSVKEDEVRKFFEVNILPKLSNLEKPEDLIIFTSILQGILINTTLNRIKGASSPKINKLGIPDDYFYSFQLVNSMNDLSDSLNRLFEKVDSQSYFKMKEISRKNKNNSDNLIQATEL